MPRFPEITRSELAVLKVLWRHRGPLSAREVHEANSGDSDWAYTTTRTIMDRMTRKGLLKRRRFHGLYIYEAGIRRALGLASVARELAERVLDVDYAPVVSLLAEGHDLSAEEVDELSRLLEDSES